MPYSRPTLQELKTRIQTDLISRLELTGGNLQRTVAGVIGGVFAGVSHVLHGFITWVARQLFVWSADDDYLLNHAGSWGIMQKAASAANGNVNFTGSAGAVVPGGTIITRSDGVLFVTAADGLANVPVNAQAVGAASNTAMGITLNLVTPIEGVQSAATVTSVGLTGGTDAESIESVRERTLEKMQAPPMGGRSSDYVQWAKEVAGVTRAWSLPLWQGLGTVGVTFVRDDDEDFIPDVNEVQIVAEHIEEYRPTTAEIFVFAPEAMPVNVSLMISPDTEAGRAAVTEELSAFFTREAEPGETIHISRLREAVSSSTSEHYHHLITPVDDIYFAAYQIATLGEVSFQ